MIEILIDIGVPVEDALDAANFYRCDERGLCEYVAVMRALLDDRHEYR